MPDTTRQDDSQRNSDPLRQLCHEISGPLTSILVLCDLLLQTPPPPQDSKGSKGFEDSRDRISSIQEEALRISRSLRAASRLSFVAPLSWRPWEPAGKPTLRPTLAAHLDSPVTLPSPLTAHRHQTPLPDFPRRQRPPLARTSLPTGAGSRREVSPKFLKCS